MDATVPPAALIDRLFRQLAPEGHALVLFDINRHAEAEPFLVSDPEGLTQALLSEANLPFSLTLVTNISPESDEVHALHREPHSAKTREELLGLSWSTGIYSLSHIALPFPPDDPMYGERPPVNPGLHLGRMELRGERGLLAFPTDQLTRLRYNPFFPYVERRVLEFVGVSGP